uniref:A-kinase anchor protein 17A n=1 Tax=Ditylenchus dipsaci TaxID=166011 RepID=A0A915CZV0_9BILA
MSEELIPFFTYRDLYLKPLNKVDITVNLPKLRQLGQSVSNWEIRERLKKMLTAIEMTDFKVLDSNLEQVQFAAIINSSADSKYVIKNLDGISFRAVGFTEPLTVSATRGDLDSQLAWTGISERPDTIYIGGLPFEWFKSPINESYETTFHQIFSEFGEVSAVDIPQCDPLRKQMDDEISGITLSSWSFGQDLFFEVYVQFKDYTGFVNAMTALCGKILVQKTPGNLLIARSLKEVVAKEEEQIKEEKSESNLAKSEELARQLMRAEKRRKFELQKNYEQKLREKLKVKLCERLHCAQKKERSVPKLYLITLLAYIGRKRQELKLRSRIAERMLMNKDYSTK